MVGMEDSTNESTETVNVQLEQALSIVKSGKAGELIKNVALLTVIYYETLVSNGIPENHAATITAHYSGHIAGTAGR